MPCISVQLYVNIFRNPNFRPTLIGAGGREGQVSFRSREGQARQEMTGSGFVLIKRLTMETAAAIKVRLCLKNRRCALRACDPIGI